MNFEFATATRIIFGLGKIKEAAVSARSMGKKGFVVTGKNPDRAYRLLASLKTNNIEKGVYNYYSSLEYAPTNQRSSIKD